MLGEKQVDFNNIVMNFHYDKFYELEEYEMKPTIREIWYWRKFYILHKFMSNLYYKKGGVGEDFNGDTLRLMIDDIDELQEFFVKYIQDDPFNCNKDVDDDIFKFVELAKFHLVSGVDIFYYASW